VRLVCSSGWFVSSWTVPYFHVSCTPCCMPRVCSCVRTLSLKRTLRRAIQGMQDTGYRTLGLARLQKPPPREFATLAVRSELRHTVCPSLPQTHITFSLTCKIRRRYHFCAGFDSPLNFMTNSGTVCIMAQGSNPGRGKRVFSSPKRSDTFWKPRSLIFNVYLGVFPGVKWPEREIVHPTLCRG
jgi:hypothetical protein